MLQMLKLPDPAGEYIVVPKLSVVITNYNYGRYLPHAIESVLSQDVPCELIVVDDCSTDNSRDIIRSYGDALTAVFLPVNGGQGAGFNAGFRAARGDLVMFLDADDFLLPGAAEKIIANRQRDAALYLYPMRYANEVGELSGIHPGRGFSEGNVSELLRERGRYIGTVTSGMVLDRAKMQRYMPMDPEAFRYGADGFIAVTAPLYGEVRRETEIVSAYRLHDAQHTRPGPEVFAKRARWRLDHDEARYGALREHANLLGLPVANDLGAHDEYHVKERLISLMFDPGQHPYQEDREVELLMECRRIALQQGTGPYRFLRAGWWTLLALLPSSARRSLFSYEIDPASRPAWLKSLARLLRRKR